MQNRYNAELSFWERESYFGPVDVAIVGSGIVGLNAAWELKRQNPKLKITVLERGFLPTGASSRNAGFACFGSVSELLADLALQPEKQVAGLVEKRWRGLQKLRKNLGDAAIDFQSWGGYELFGANEEVFAQCQEKIAYLNQLLAPVLGMPAVYRNADQKISRFGFANVNHLIECVAEGQIDTGKMMAALTRKVQTEGAQILCGQEVLELQEEQNHMALQLANGATIKAKSVVVCTNGFARQLLPDMPVVPARAQVLVTKPIAGLKLKGTYHFEEGYYYFRNIGDRVLFGGARNLDFSTEETTQFGLTSTIQEKLETMLREVILPGTTFEIDQRWSGIMGMGPEKGPIIQSVSDKVICAVRLGGMGVAIGTQVGEEAAHLALAKL